MHCLLGRGFNALDVIGLASVGLSTKGANTDEPKRTIGFMGVGFKAVYKRWIIIMLKLFNISLLCQINFSGTRK